ncbi:MAG: B12-binding domain-containing radical SAM protein [Ignavibacteriaceae bacterium]|nr:B12-binding domain-containing radical SAM protein [Ignavibacteriaceae bacterium]
MSARRRLVLVNPMNPARTGLTVNRTSRFPPLGLGQVAALTPRNWDVELIDENWEPFRYRPADLVGLTAFTAAAPRAYEIARRYRAERVPVVMGGIHASMCPDEALEHVDSVVTGEAESAWPALMRDFEEARLQRIYQGSWLDLAGLPFPRRDIFNPRYLFASVQTSRGCPMDCEFCSVTAFNGRRYRRRPSDEVLKELESIPQKMIFFVDDNLIGYGHGSQEAVLALFRGMVERRLDKWWFCQASVNFADDEETLRWAARAGCKMVFLGLEAIDTEALRTANKKLNLSRGVDSYARVFRRIHKAGIGVLGAFIFGLDGDTHVLMKNRCDYMIRSGIDVMQATYLTPLPGTRLFSRYQADDRLLKLRFPLDWAEYDMTGVIHRPTDVDPRQLEETMWSITSRIYAPPVLVWKALRAGLTTRDPIVAMFVWNSNLNYRRVAFASCRRCRDARAASHAREGCHRASEFVGI